jgi:hypothetical protein
VPWHQDTALPLRRQVESDDWGPWSAKARVLYAHAPAWALDTVIALRVSLDDSLDTNGPLRVLPDTHRFGVLTDAEIAELAQVATPVVCTTKAGGVVAMKPRERFCWVWALQWCIPLCSRPQRRSHRRQNAQRLLAGTASGAISAILPARWSREW